MTMFKPSLLAVVSTADPLKSARLLTPHFGPGPVVVSDPVDTLGQVPVAAEPGQVQSRDVPQPFHRISGLRVGDRGGSDLRALLGGPIRIGRTCIIPRGAQIFLLLAERLHELFVLGRERCDLLGTQHRAAQAVLGRRPIAREPVELDAQSRIMHFHRLQDKQKHQRDRFNAILGHGRRGGSHRALRIA